jgi:hypothetical protein
MSEVNLILTVALAAAVIVIVLALVCIIIYQRWRIGDKNAALGRFIKENAEMRQKMLRAGLLSFALFFLCCYDYEHYAAKYINVEAAIGSISPAGTTFATGDKMTLYAWAGNADAASANIVADGVECTYGSDSRWSAANPVAWSGTDTPHYFIAFYPAHTVSSFTADPYTLNPSDQRGSDLLVARNLTGVRPSETPVPLLFGHAMSRLDVNLQFRNQWAVVPTVGSVTAKAANSCTIDYLAETYNVGAQTDIALPAAETAEGYALSYSSIMVPQNFRTVTINVNGQPYTFTNTQDIPLSAGKFVTLNLFVGSDRIDLGTVSIDDWVAGAVVEGGSSL